MEFFGLGDVPDEVREQMERARMENEVLKHDIERFLDNLDKDEVLVLRYILRTAQTSAGYAPYLDGMLGGVLKYKYNVCGCGTDHTAELLAETVEGVVPSSDVPTPAEQAANVADQMIEYGMRFPRPGEVDAGPGEQPVVCVGCEMLYQSLEDRVMLEPGVKGCTGCQQKAKWG